MSFDKIYFRGQEMKRDTTAGMGYLSQRGKITTTRPYADLNQDEREQILEDHLTIGSKETRAKWNISSQTLHHVRWHNKEAEQEIENKHFGEHGL
jgi:hypothetical protein